MVIAIINFAFCQKWVKQPALNRTCPGTHGKLLATIAGVVVLVAIATSTARPGYRTVWCWASSLGIVVIFAKETIGLKALRVVK